MTSLGCLVARNCFRHPQTPGRFAPSLLLPLLLAGCITEKPKKRDRAWVEASVAAPDAGLPAVGPLVWGLGPGAFGDASAPGRRSRRDRRVGIASSRRQRSVPSSAPAC